VSVQSGVAAVKTQFEGDLRLPQDETERSATFSHRLLAARPQGFGVQFRLETTIDHLIADASRPSAASHQRGG